jgi:uncharacterized protein (TIGR03435 family)
MKKISIALGLTIAASVHATAAQPSEQSRLAFEVVSIKRSLSQNRGGLMETLPGRFVATNVTLKMLFRPAHGIRNDFQIAGGPSWIDTERYDIQATMGFAANTEDVHRMLQTLLAEKFGVVLHHEPKEVPVYVLVLGKNELKLKEVPEGGVAASPKASNDNGLTLVGLAESLSRLPSIDRPVLDRTALSGRYDMSPLLNGARSKAQTGDASIFTAIQDFGLKLEAQKATIDVLVIDHADRPPDN